MKYLFPWIFYGLFMHCSFQRYVVIKTFVGPPRKTMYQECCEILDQMDQTHMKYTTQLVEKQQLPY